MRPNRLQLERHKPLFGLVAALMCSSALIPSGVAAAPLPSCSGIAAQLLAGEGVSAATSAIQPAAGGHLSYCLVNITVSELAGPKDGYLLGQKQMINIGIGLPLSPTDGGTGGSDGAWNQRIQDLGGGGYAGVVGPVTPATDTGYVGSSTDTGHPASAGGTPTPAWPGAAPWPMTGSRSTDLMRWRSPITSPWWGAWLGHRMIVTVMRNHAILGSLRHSVIVQPDRVIIV